MVERVAEKRLPLPEKKLLSPQPQVKIIAISRAPEERGLEQEITGKFAKLQQAIKEKDWSTAQSLAEEYQGLIIQANILKDIGSSTTILAGEAAATCYSGRGIFTPEDYLKRSHAQVIDGVITSTRESGHLTTRQHAHITFGLDKVSRAVLWTFLHSHPFYNSEQVSQRYVEMKPGNFTIPPLEGEALAIYEETARKQMEAYQALLQSLRPVVEEKYFDLFPGRRLPVKDHPETRKARTFARKIDSSTQEIARYILPIATHAYLYHSVSALTLMRYQRTCELHDIPLEQKILASKMVNAVLEQDPRFFEEITDPFPLEETPEYQALTSLRQGVDEEAARQFTQEFDKELNDQTSRLIGSFGENTEPILAGAVRQVLGLSKGKLSDKEAISLLLNPTQNRTLGDTLNITTHTKLNRVMQLVSYTFAKKISHTADSQDQRHRMTPASRPVLATHYDGRPDYIIPALIAQNPEALKVYEAVMEETFGTINNLLKRGVPAKYALYLLPNAFPVRFTETGTLLNLRHKFAMRLCFNAQEEIWNATREEVAQISQIHPLVGKYLLPPCGTRNLTGDHPICPEAERFCGVLAWKLEPEEYKRTI